MLGEQLLQFGDVLFELTDLALETRDVGAVASRGLLQSLSFEARCLACLAAQFGLEDACKIIQRYVLWLCTR